MGPYKPLRTWVDGHPLLYGNNGSLDPGTYRNPPQTTHGSAIAQPEFHYVTPRGFGVETSQ